MGYDYSLSASKLNLFRECQRCFYDANVLKIDRPRGIFPSLPGGVDRVAKTYLDKFRGKVPPHLKSEMTGQLWGSVGMISRLRNWRTGLKATMPINGKTVSLIGALDDLIVEEDETYSPYDTKTKGAEPQGDGAEYYQGQLDIYALLLRENGMMPSGKAYLDYWYPVAHDGMAMSWGSRLFTLLADPARAVDTIAMALAVLSSAQPAPNDQCEYCRFATARSIAGV